MLLKACVASVSNIPNLTFELPSLQASNAILFIFLLPEATLTLLNYFNNEFSREETC